MGLCACRYTGERPTTNMVVIEAKLPSGYSPEKGSVVEVRGHGGAPTLGAGPGWGTHRVAIAQPELCPSS